jgi:hypothetical protein
MQIKIDLKVIKYNDFLIFFLILLRKSDKKIDSIISLI